MDYSGQVTKFCMNQKSIITIISNFVGRFMEWYENEERAEQEILTQCVLQMFRKYYYSALDPETMITPANIVNTLCEREFGADLMVVPGLKVICKGKKVSRLENYFNCFKIDNHPAVGDMEALLEIAATSIRMESPGIPLNDEYPRFKKDILLFDRHYINIITLIALEAGYIECEKSGKCFIGKTAPKSEEWFNLDSEKKLLNLIESATSLCSKTIIQAFPELQKEFPYIQVANFLRNPRSYESVMTSVFKKMDIDLKQLERSLSMGNIEGILNTIGTNEENTVKFYWFQNMLDIYFFTPFSYYLQLIQPVYPDIYDMGDELNELLSEIDDFTIIRNKLFSPAMEYDLTVLGESLWAGGKKPRRERKIPSNIGDEEMLQIVLESAAYLESDVEEFELTDGDDDDDDNFLITMDELFNMPPPEKSRTAKIIEFPVKKDATVANPMDDLVFVFKVELSYAKRIWRQIEVKGNQTLHELHQSILESFVLDADHLYAFFMSNKFWDKKTEYAHPAAESRSADNIKISNLQLDVKQKFAYVYDFGDEHRFEIELTATHEPEKGIKYPRETKRNKP